MYAEYKNGMREGKGKGEKEYIPIGNVSTHKGLRSFKLFLDRFQRIFYSFSFSFFFFLDRQTDRDRDRQRQRQREREIAKNFYLFKISRILFSHFRGDKRG